MRFDVLTLFPEMFKPILQESVIGNALEKGIIQLNLANIRDFSRDKHKSVDDYPYGGGAGMVMQAEPIYDAYMSLIKGLDASPKVIYLSPQGRMFTQETAKELSSEKHLILLCGHYEGIDERIIEEIVTDEISIGDYVLTGGELPAMVLIDAVSRMIPGVLSAGSSEEESLYNSLLEYPQYTRPEEFRGKRVPDVLLSGHHANIARWRREQAVMRTYKKRPDLLQRAELSDEDREIIKFLDKKK